MNAMKNRVQLIGRLGQDPEVRTLNSGRMVAQFSLATSEVYKNSAGERVQDTQWHQVIAWGKLAEISENLLIKGQEVVVEGKISYRNYEDKNGIKRYVTEIIASDIMLVGKRLKEKGSEVAEQEAAYEELPF
ncbi:single-strand DNA-binding protein [Catalinimonas alkaloidigena]|uniref:single-stranded DNA-binding protein n=1 Tax=Catalinimonas alkaloidigena TaxID=1075417 RepID=UPI0024050D9C|nr:single-stranded DNA-binding protein [Catalinimonas alkaloidigena]MDF9795890.1 single-strand DNA-binding protein [Catalinimonas alkaloidigena]